MSELGFNKIAGALLATGLGILGIKEVAHLVFADEPSVTEGGYVVTLPEPVAGAGAADEGPKLPPDWGTLFAEANLPALVAQGEKVHKVCTSCHRFEAGGANGTGPALYGVVNRTAGSHPGFNYSGPMKAHAKPWTYDELYAFLENPKGVVAGTSMSYAGMKKSEDRVALVAYLRSMAPAPAAVPAPDPARQPGAAAPAADAAAAPEAAPAAPADAPATEAGR